MDHVSRAFVKAAEARAHAADEVADCAGLMLADALIDQSADVELLTRNYRSKRADATYAWAVFSDAVAKRAGIVA